MKVVWAPAALSDLEAISDHIGADNPARAESFVQDILLAGDGIADIALGYPIIPQLADRGVRRRRFGRYLIFYRIAAEAIQILHVVHGARDYVRVLFADE